MLRRRETPSTLKDRTPRSFQMAKSQKTVLALPQREGVETAAPSPILLPNLKHSSSDHPHHERIRRPTQCLCGPTSTPTAKSSKKPKMQATGDMFPTNWSPPPIEFLAPRARQAGKGAQARKWVGTVGPQGLRRLACWVPSELEQKFQASDTQGNLASLEELFWNTAGPNQEAAASLLTPGDSESYINSLDYLLQEKREQALEQEPEKLLAQGCPDLGSLDLDEEDLPLTPEHRELVERFSMSLQTIPSVHPGETMFLPRRHPLPCILDYSHVKPRNHLEELFLSSPLAQQLSFLRGGFLSNLYLQAPAPTCPVPLLQWLFQLLTWPPETSSRAFGLLWDLSVDRIFCQSDGDVRVWCPSLREIVEAFHSLGAHSPALCLLRPSPHSERVLKREASLSQGEQQDTPQETALDISLSYIYKFLTLCALVQPGATTDENLLDLIELLCRAGLDVQLRLLPQTDLQQLLLLLLENIQEWPGKLRQLCCALSLVSDHHHNLLALVQFFLDVTSRSRQLRSQLSLVVIARLLDQQETLSLWQEKTQLVELSRLLSLMRPSCLGPHLDSETLPPCQERQPKASAELDHKVCYLCHSLLTLAGVVVSCQDITPDQWAAPSTVVSAGRAAAAMFAVGLPHQHPYPGEPPGHAPDQTQGPSCPDLHPLAGAAVPLPAPGPVLPPLGRHLMEQGRNGPWLSALAGSEQDPRNWRKQRGGQRRTSLMKQEPSSTTALTPTGKGSCLSLPAHPTPTALLPCSACPLYPRPSQAMVLPPSFLSLSPM